MARTLLVDNAEVNRSCQVCGPATKLRVKTNREKGTQFLGCPNWPECSYTEKIPEDLKLISQGAQRLPGF